MSPTATTTTPDVTHHLPEDDSDDDDDDQDEKLTAQEKLELAQRQKLRLERQKARETAARTSTQAPRDISERIALGQAKPTASKESMFDARLFNQTSGMSSGFSGSSLVQPVRQTLV